ncbi:MAG: hypothetical protein QM754_07785 [Tepidisphaeraceae bacterium]
MADSHSTTLRGIDYKSTFPFVHLFKGFRLAMDPSKLVLALALLLIVYSSGCVMDAIWPDKHRAVANEVEAYAATDHPTDFGKFREERILARDAAIKAELARLGKPDDKPTYRSLVDAYKRQRDTLLKAAEILPKQNAPEALRRDTAIREVHASYARQVAAAKSLSSEGLFIHFLMFEVHTVDSIVINAVKLNGDGVAGVVEGLKDFFITAPAWAFKTHPVYFTLFFAWLLVLWSIFGGALARIASVQVARDEKISLRQALRFSTGKVLSFLFAPLIPAIIIGFLGLVLAVASILISVPGISGIWSIVIGAAFILALLAGLVMMLTAVGLIGGGHLMYPTIASEGSDSFDAVSRSFSYLYARPWQLGFYALVSIIYGAITFLVVRLALYILLLMVHGAISLFQWGNAADGTPIIDAMWPRPTNFMTLSYDVNYAALGGVQAVGASLIAFWVYLAISLLGAYVISLYASSSTLVYFLLRRDVDATELDEVYLETDEDELNDAIATSDVTESAEPAGQPVDTPTPPPAS